MVEDEEGNYRNRNTYIEEGNTNNMEDEVGVNINAADSEVERENADDIA